MYFVDSLTWEICIIGLSLSAFTFINLLTKSYKHDSDILLSIWLVLLNIPLLHTALSHLNIHTPTFDFYTNPTLNLLHGPMLYLYVRVLISQNKVEVQRSEFFHFILFAVYYLLFIAKAHPKPMIPFPNDAKANVGPMADSGIMSLFEPLLAHFGWIGGVVFIAYSIVTIYTLLKHQQNIAEIFSQNDNEISLKWLYALPVTFVALVMLNFVNENALDTMSVIAPHTFHMLSFLSFIILLCFFGVKQKPVFFLSRILGDMEKRWMHLRQFWREALSRWLMQKRAKTLIMK